MIETMSCRYFSISQRLHSVWVSKSNIINQKKCFIRFNQNDNRIHLNFLYNTKKRLEQIFVNQSASDNLKNLYEKISRKIILLNKPSKKLKTRSTNLEKSDVCNISVKIYDTFKNPIPEEMKCLNLIIDKTPIQLAISDQLFDIVNINTPWVLNYDLPKYLFVGFPVYPQNFESCDTDRELSKFNWYRSINKSQKGNEIAPQHAKWDFITSNFHYTPNLEDVGMKLKLECVPVNSSSIGPTVETVSKNVVTKTPNSNSIFPFERRQTFTSTKLFGNRFRCVSYNILADLYCDSDYSRTVLFPYCPPEALSIDYRVNLITKEIFGYNADIMCLQEVDKKVFENFLRPTTNLYNNYDCLFYQEGKNIAVGLACFYRKDRFRLLEEKSILLANLLQSEEYLETIWSNIKDNKALIERLLNRGTMASATVLQSCDSPNEVLLVGNTHLYFHPDADHIRLIQGGIIINWLKYLKSIFMKEMPNKRVTLILCGDFNSMPHNGVYKLYTAGTAPDTLPDWKSNANEAVVGLSLTQDILLESACGTPEFTNYTSAFKECIDYIYYEKNNLNVTQVVPLPSKEEVSEHTALPSVGFPSDHIALVADLQYKN